MKLIAFMGKEAVRLEVEAEETKLRGFVILNNDLAMAEWGYINFAEIKSINVNGFEVDCELEEFWEIRPAKMIARISKAQRWQFPPHEDNKGGAHGIHTRT